MPHLDLDALEPGARYKLLTAVVIPRPVAWVTTVDAHGTVNAAPYSFFNVFGEEPALIVLGLQHKGDGSPKDTTRNIAASGEFVVNIATPALLASMVDTAAAYPPDTGEPEALGLPLAPSVRVAPPRLADAPAALECRKLVNLSFGPNRDLLIGEAIGLASREGLIDPERHHVDWRDDWPVARLFADRYAALHELPRHAIPSAPSPRAPSSSTSSTSPASVFTSSVSTSSAFTPPPSTPSTDEPT